MRLDWRFPAIVRAHNDRTSRVRRCLVSVAGEFDIQEVSRRDMPLAFLARTGNPDIKSDEFRVHDGALYRHFEEVGLLEEADRARDVLGRDFNPYHRQVADILLREATLPDELPIWPKEVLKSPGKGLETIEASAIRPTAEGLGDIEEWRDRFRESLGRFLIVDGEVWYRTAEPVYLAHMKTGVLSVSTGDLFDNCALSVEDQVRGDPYDNSRPYGWNVLNGFDYRVFSWSQLEAVLAILPDDLEVVDDFEEDKCNVISAEAVPSGMEIDTDTLELDRIARTFSHAVGVHFSREVNKVANVHTVPTAFLVAWGGLRDLLASYRPSEGVPERLSDAVQTLLEETRLFRERGGFDYGRLAPEGMIEGCLERWHSRSIDIGAAVPTPSMR